MKILAIGGNMTSGLPQSEDYNIHAVLSDEEGVDLARHYDYDVIVIASELSVIRQIRTSQVKTPIIVVLPVLSVGDRLAAFRLGADDCLTTPFLTDELTARIHAVVRRSRGFAHSVIRTGDIAINLDTRFVEVGGKPMHLPGREFAILEILSLRKGMTMTREALMEYLYGGRDEPAIKIIDVMVCKLRKRLAAAGADHHVETVWGRGYVLKDPATTNEPMDTELAEMTDNPPVHVSKMTFREYSSMKGKPSRTNA